MDYKFTFRIFIILLMFTAFSGVVVAQENAATTFPDRIVLNLTQDASNSIAVTWRTDITIPEGFCELQLSTGSHIKPENTKSFKAKTTAAKYDFEGEPTIEANQHSYVFKDLIPGGRYLYRVGSEGYWSEWLEFEIPSADNNFSFV